MEPTAWLLNCIVGRLVSKGLDHLVASLSQTHKTLKDELVVAIRSALESDTALAQHCDDVPGVSNEVVKRLEDAALLEACLADDPRVLVDLIHQKGGYSLPGFRGNDEDAVSLLRRAAQAALSRLFEALKSNDALFREFVASNIVQERGAAIQTDKKLDYLIEGVDRLSAATPLLAGSARNPAQQLVAQDRQESLALQIRALLDQQGKDKLDAAKEALDSHQWHATAKAARELENWLQKQGSKVSGDVRGRIFIFLADAAVSEEFVASAGSAIATTRAWESQRMAADAFGDAPSPEDAERLSAVAARLMFLDGKGEEALKRLEVSDSPHAVAMRLAILLDTDRAEEAATLAAGLQLHTRWVHLAIGAAVRAGRQEDAEKMLQWATQHDEGTTTPRSILFYVTERLHVLLTARFGNRPAQPRELGADDRDQLRHLQTTLEPVVQTALRLEKATSGLEVDALSLLLRIGFLLRDKGLGVAVAKALATSQPVPLAMGEAVLLGYTECPPDLPSRLRTERPKSFEAKVLAAYLESECLGQHEEALKALRDLSEETPEAEQRERLAGVVHEVVQKASDSIHQEGADLVRRVLGDIAPLTRFMAAEQHLRRKAFAEAKAIIEEHPDESDAVWLQLRGVIAAQAKEWDLALESFEKAARLVTHPEVLNRLAEAAFRSKRYYKAADALEQVCEAEPGNAASWWNLAQAYSGLAKHKQEAEALSKYLRLRPNDLNGALNLARSLAVLGRLDEAVSMLDTHCVGEPPAIEAVLLRAQVLQAAGKPDRALEGLNSVRRHLWDDPRFLLTYMSAGFAANRESEAHEALQRLTELQKAGKVPSSQMRPFSLEEMKELFTSRRAFLEEVNRLYLMGRAPWIMVEEQKNRAAYVGWAVRTQDLCLSDEPQARAEYTIYATNSFHPSQEESRGRTLMPLAAPPRGSEVVADLSALITLHRLGLLGRLPEYFGKVYTPDIYQVHALKDREDLQPHQASQEHAARAIVEAMNKGAISVMAPSQQGTAQVMPLLSEYEEDAPPEFQLIRLGQAFQWLHTKGLLDDPTFTQVKKVCHAKTLVDDGAATELLEKGALAAGLHTLITIHGQGVLDTLLRAFRVQLSEADAREARSAVMNAEYREQILTWHKELFDFLQSSPQIEFVPTNPLMPRSDEKQVLAWQVHYATAAAEVALHRRMPLLADDRACQMAVLNTQGEPNLLAFGADILAHAMAKEGVIGIESEADAVLQLIKWRYRFLVPSSKNLIALAARHRLHPPGEPLHEVARYAHDCMRDAGLFLGKEPTEPPMPMGLRLFSGWINALASFCIDVFRDDRFDESTAEQLVGWALQECMPGAPLGLPLMGRRAIDRMTPMSVLGVALTRSMLLHDDVPKATRAVRLIAGALGIQDDEYASIVDHTIGLYAQTLNDLEEEPKHALLARLLRIAVGDSDQLSVRLLPIVERLGVVELADDSEVPPDEDLSAILDPAHARRAPAPPGPYVFLKDTGEGQPKIRVVFVPEMLLSRVKRAREAGLAYLQSSVIGRWISPSTEAIIREYADAIRADAPATWVPASSRVHDALKEDFALDAAGFAQSRLRNFNDGMEMCCGRMLRPSFDSLLSTQDDGWGFLRGAEELPSRLEDGLPKNAPLAAFLDRYESLVGHLPLSEPLDLGSRLHAWLGDAAEPHALWDALCAWATGSGSPWRKYHVCRALVAHPEWIPTDRMQEFWQNITEIASLLAADSESFEAQAWLLRSRLAAHYLRYLELHSFSMDPTRLMTVAWWAAGKAADGLTAGLKRNEETMKAVKSWLEGPLKQAFSNTTFLWGMVRTASSFSVPRYTTLNLTHPWSTALLASLGRGVGGLDLDAATPEQKARLAQAYVACLLTSPTAIVEAEARPIWEWEQSVLRAAERFCGALPEQQRPRELTAVLAMATVLADPNTIKETTELFPQAQEQAALFLAMTLRTLCYCQPGFAKIAWEKVHDTTWWGSRSANLPPDALQALADGLLEIQSKAGVQWHLEMPYLWLTATEAQAENPLRCEVLLGAFINSVLVAQTAAPIRRLLAGEQMPRLREHLVRIRERLREMVATTDPRFAPPARDAVAALASL